MKLLLYCTKSKPYLYQGFAKPMHTKDKNNPLNYKWHLLKTKTSAALNGKVVGECDFEIDRAYPFHHWCKELQEETCLTRDEVLNYLDSKNKEFSNPKIQRGVYAIHLNNLHIFDTPRELSDYRVKPSLEKIKQAPQNMMYVYDIANLGFHKDVLMSIKPKWLCKILNGEKTIEIRKVVPNDMLYYIKINWDVRDFK